MPEPAFFEDEQIYAGKKQYTPQMRAQIDDFAAKLRLARTLTALSSIRQDIGRSLIISNPTALEDLRQIANECAKGIDRTLRGVWWE